MQVKPPPQQMQSAYELYDNAAMHVQVNLTSQSHRPPFPDLPGTYSYKTNMHNILRDAHGMAARKQAGPVSPTLTE